jgi:hypothetical protein
MPQGIQPFDQDFIIITPTEMRVRHGIQDTRLGTFISGESENTWESYAGTCDDEHTTDTPSHQEYPSVWESTLERL